MPHDSQLSVVRLSKRFGPALVLDGVDLDVRPGRIHGLIGQNGAGKSTLVKTLAGLYPDHTGEIRVGGTPVALKNPRQSRRQGIAVIHQEFSLVPSMTVAENLLLGREKPGIGYSAKVTRATAAQVLDEITIDTGTALDTVVGDLGPAVMQRIEIAKALAQDARVLVMDEPTARLSELEREWLFTTMRTLSDRGVGIMFISHFLEEVRGITDDLTVLRNGRVARTAPTAEFSLQDMAELMLGRELQDRLENDARTSRAGDHPVALEAVGLSAGPRLRDVTLTLRRHEIVCVAGLVGSGRTRLARVLAGADQPTEGHLTVDGEVVRLRSPRDAIARGIALIPEDRKHQGLSMQSPISANLSLMALQSHLGTAAYVPRRAVRQLAERSVTDLQISPARTDLDAGALSGGNQQKVLLGKALAARPGILVIDQPTAGVDVGTKAQIQQLLHDQAGGGAAVLVVSDDVEELYALADRLVVMRKGRIIWQGLPADLTRNHLLTLMSTGTHSSHDDAA